MTSSEAAYLAELARQFGFLSAFLGALSGAFMVQLLPLSHPRRRLVSACVLAAAAATVAFIVAVLGATLLVAATHPSAPSGLASASVVGGGGALAALPFLAGVYLLLLTVGLAGWIRSPRLGWATAALATAGALFGGWTLVGF
jgi:hypothetical protein